MNTFNWESFTKKIAVKAPITDLYNAWTKSKEIEKWFLSKATGSIVKRNGNITQNDTCKWFWYFYNAVGMGSSRSEFKEIGLRQNLKDDTYNIEIGDINNDGYPDIIESNSGTWNLFYRTRKN